MIDAFPCPVCGAGGWLAVQSFRYRREDHREPSSPARLAWRKILDYGRILLRNGPGPSEVTIRALTEKERRNRRVLFDVWVKDRPSIRLESRICTGCGFMAYAPRPTEEDLQAKYAFYLREGRDVGGEQGHSDAARALDAGRARRIFDRVMTRQAGRAAPLTVLDYGGGNGKLLTPFLQQGHDCFLVDYNRLPLPGIVRLADDIRGLPPGMRFDVVLVNHVLEHVVQPLDLIQRLRDRLADGGLIQAEVPLEIWCGIRIGPDPVTHINFFTPECFDLLFERARMAVLDARTETGQYGASRLLVRWLVAERAPPEERCTPAAAGVRVRGILTPGRWSSIRRMWRLLIGPKIAGRLQALAARARKHHERG
jgi:SAM-dependent methyltransferase